MKNIQLIAILALFTLNACSGNQSKKDDQPIKEEVLYQTIKKRYPSLSDEKIKSEVSDTIKDLV